jgi:DNA primase
MTPEELFSKILLKKDISDEVARMFEIGLLVKDRVVGHFPGNPPFKFLRDIGLIFPIKDLYGNVISVYLRRLSKEGPKYDSLPFNKNVLFGLNKTFPFIYRQGAILVEGPFDVFTLITHKIYNVCALLGTNISIYQIALLRRFTDKCFVMLDGDAIGQTKSVEIYNELIQYGFEAEIIRLPSGYDPNSYITQYGALPGGIGGIK